MCGHTCLSKVGQAVTTSGELSQRLAQDLGLVALPGTAFGLPPSNLSLRVSLIVGDFSKLDAQNLDQDFLARKWVGIVQDRDRGPSHPTPAFQQSTLFERGSTRASDEVSLGLGRELADWSRLKEVGVNLCQWI